MHLRAGCLLVLLLAVPCGLDCVDDELRSAAHDSLGEEDEEGPCMKKKVHRYTNRNSYATCRLRRDLSVLERSIAVFKLRKVCTISAENQIVSTSINKQTRAMETALGPPHRQLTCLLRTLRLEIVPLLPPSVVQNQLERV